MRIDFVTIFPNMFAPLLAEGVIARGVKQSLLDIRLWDLRDYTTDRHRSVDDVPYGGGPGMVMKAEPLMRAVDQIRMTEARIASTQRNTGSPSITMPGPPP